MDVTETVDGVPADPSKPGLAQRIADTIRGAVHRCTPHTCGVDDGECDDEGIGIDCESGGTVYLVHGTPEAFGEVCAAVVRAELDAKDAEIARMTDIANRYHAMATRYQAEHQQIGDL